MPSLVGSEMCIRDRARTDKELPVLIRHFIREQLKPEIALYLDLILYSKEQIQKENQAMKNIDPNKDIEYEYGIVSIKPQMIPEEIPMEPITMMRNALGREEGGSGVPLDKNKYLKSVQFWQEHAILK
eukprot:TRINITY_DN25392_c0_g1_i2.p3 TRINITY_DN25392_c0_g1~~TRINITY_DN25392_c0_g1_i2.p3  ORF type:complete len:128 (+),score=19.56 TRINITY_DN25392_c0_g1_i2:119-502(+)